MTIEHGCLIDGHWGQYATTRMIEIGVELGFPIDADSAAMVRAYNAGSNDDTEAVVDLSDAVERWLNDNVAEEGCAFGWEDGEFFYNSVDEWETEI